jgi:hypothetical protein
MDLRNLFPSESGREEVLSGLWQCETFTGV